MANFGTLYDYVTNSGIVIPQTSDIKAKVEAAFIDIFGSDFSFDTETPAGRLVEAITFLFLNALVVNAQNANQLNPGQATGNYLDAIGALFGTSRLTGMNDAKYRELILSAQSRGSGYTQSIRNALSNVDGVTSICVLENGYGDPRTEPNDVYGIAVAPHSVFVAVAGGTDQDVADAIYSAKSAGCGYTTSGNFGDAVKKVISIQDGTGNAVTFYRPVLRDFDVYLNIIGSLTSDEAAAVKNAVVNLFKEKSNTCIVTSGDIISAVARGVAGVACTGAYMVAAGESTHRSEMTILPFQYCNITSNDVIISES